MAEEEDKIIVSKVNINNKKMTKFEKRPSFVNCKHKMVLLAVCPNVRWKKQSLKLITMIL
jgi:hypothetical protein